MFRRVDYKLKARLEPSAKQWCMAIGDKILNARYAPSIIKCLSEAGIVETRLLCILNRLPRCSGGVPLEKFRQMLLEYAWSIIRCIFELDIVNMRLVGMVWDVLFGR
jgi:hypothetical protein